MLSGGPRGAGPQTDSPSASREQVPFTSITRGYIDVLPSLLSLAGWLPVLLATRSRVGNIIFYTA